MPLISWIPTPCMMFLRNDSLDRHRPCGLLHISMQSRPYYHPLTRGRGLRAAWAYELALWSLNPAGEAVPHLTRVLITQPPSFLTTTSAVAACVVVFGLSGRPSNSPGLQPPINGW